MSSFSTPRHRWSADFCDRIEQVAQGSTASLMCSNFAPEPGEGCRVGYALPMWGWRTARIDLGRKAVGPAGTTLTLPVRISWSHPLVGAASPGELLTWHAQGMGHDLTGAVRLGTADQPMADLDATIRSQALTDAPQFARALVEAGTQARWEVMEMLEPMIAGEVNKAHAAVAGELGTGAVLDPISLATAADELLLGTAQRSSAAARFIDKVLTKQDTFARVDPLRAARVEFYRCARQTILLAIGDPREGRKIRALADLFRRTDGSIDLDALLAAYRVKHPADRLGRDRAVAALTAGADLMASAVRYPALLDLVVAA